MKKLTICSGDEVLYPTISQPNLLQSKGYEKEECACRLSGPSYVFATLATCASTRTHESTGEYVDDSVITTKVKALLAEDDFLKSFQISVETYKGTVQLSGFVDSQQALDKTGQIAQSVNGVQSVKNDMIAK